MLADAPGQLRKQLEGEGLVWGPGVYDGISAQLANAIGFPMLLMSGAATAASRTGLPDLGLATATDVTDNARVITSVADAPVIADADNGFGSLINLIRTVHQFEQAGVAGIHIEDQLFPKRCGHMAGKTVMERDEYKRRMHAAVEERMNPDFLIIARIDAIAPLGFDEAMARLNDAFDAGVDMGDIEAPESIEQIERIAAEAPGPMYFNAAIRSGKTPTLTVKQVEDYGFAIGVWPGVTAFAAFAAMRQALMGLKEQGTDHHLELQADLMEFFNGVGHAQWIERDAKYASYV